MVVTNTFEGLSISISGEEVSKIVHAIAKGKKESPLVEAAVGHRLEFYKGSGHLGTVVTSAEIFWIGKTPYIDKTETLNGLYRRIQDASFRKVP